MFVLQLIKAILGLLVFWGFITWLTYNVTKEGA